jgi:hypothetical protein
MSEMLDTFGTPEYFSTHLGALEDAGGGMIRVIRCVQRNGVLVPVCSIVMPAVGVLRDGPLWREIATKITRGEMAVH